MGPCHRPWYIGGKVSRWIPRFAKIALRWCKRWQTVTRIFRHNITDDDRRQIFHVVRRTTYYTAFPRRIAASSSPKDIKDIFLGICVIILDHMVGIQRSYHSVSFLVRRLWYWEKDTLRWYRTPPQCVCSNIWETRRILRVAHTRKVAVEIISLSFLVWIKLIIFKSILDCYLVSLVHIREPPFQPSSSVPQQAPRTIFPAAWLSQSPLNPLHCISS